LRVLLVGGKGGRRKKGLSKEEKKLIKEKGKGKRCLRFEREGRGGGRASSRKRRSNYCRHCEKKEGKRRCSLLLYLPEGRKEKGGGRG